MTTAAKLLPRDVAFIVRRNAAAYLAENLGRVIGDGHDRARSASLAAAAYRDYADLLDLAELLEDDQTNRAAFAAARLETVPREALDHAAYDWLISNLPK